MDQEETLRPSFYAALVSGATLLAVLSFTGAVWPYAPDTTSLKYLAFSCGTALIGFFSTAFLFCAASLARGRAGLDWLRVTANLIAVIILFASMILTSGLVVEAMNGWFDEPPRMPGVMIRIVQAMFLAGLLPLFLAIIWRLALPLFAILRRARRR